jgi:hypothetical protein
MDLSVDNNISKKNGKPNFNGKEVGMSFFQYFYTTWLNNPDVLISDMVVREHSKLQFKDTIYTGMEFIGFMKQLGKVEFSDMNCEVYDSGSRQVQLLVTGRINNMSFSQFIMIVYMGEKVVNKWSLMNSILSIT